ncbi:MAG: hypothetical protein OXT74_03445 [Candidatus Poribacteria bacterium]|nr:hypothetical protein [Candidatus Poribacteria bacterium]
MNSAIEILLRPSNERKTIKRLDMERDSKSCAIEILFRLPRSAAIFDVLGCVIAKLGSSDITYLKLTMPF